jgi:hypothetical protein
MEKALIEHAIEWFQTHNCKAEDANVEQWEKACSHEPYEERGRRLEFKDMKFKKRNI